MSHRYCKNFRLAGIGKVVVFFFFFVAAGLNARLEAAVQTKGPAQKFGRGITHVITSPFQIPKEIIQTTSKAEIVYLAPWKGITSGFGSGVYHGGRQLISGFNDVFTFWTPQGRDWAPVYDSESLVPEI